MADVENVINNSLEELVQQLKKSFLTNFDSKDINDGIKENQSNNDKIDIFSYLSLHLSKHNSRNYIYSSPRISSEVLPKISEDTCNNLTNKKCRKKQKKSFNCFYESNMQSTGGFENLKQTKKFLIKFRNSRLLVEFFHDLSLENSTCNICARSSHGYSQINAGQAISRIIGRDLFKIENTIYSKTKSNSRWSEENICRKFISVPSLDSTHINPRLFLFEGRGVNNNEAEVNCNLRILEELCDFDLIKEASLELYTRNRKELLDPTKKLNLKLFAWLEASVDTWIHKMKEIAVRETGGIECQFDNRKFLGEIHS